MLGWVIFVRLLGRMSVHGPGGALGNASSQCQQSPSIDIIASQNVFIELHGAKAFIGATRLENHHNK